MLRQRKTRKRTYSAWDTLRTYVKVVVSHPECEHQRGSALASQQQQVPYLPGSCCIVHIVAAQRFHVEGVGV